VLQAFSSNSLLPVRNNPLISGLAIFDTAGEQSVAAKKYFLQLGLQYAY
jgi:hypothetical protein